MKTKAQIEAKIKELIERDSSLNACTPNRYAYTATRGSINALKWVLEE